MGKNLKHHQADKIVKSMFTVALFVLFPTLRNLQSQ